MSKLVIAKHVLVMVMTIHGKVPAKVCALAASTALDAYSTNAYLSKFRRGHETDPIASVPCGGRNAACLDLGAALTSAAVAALVIAKPHSKLAIAAADSLAAGHAAAAVSNLEKISDR